MRIFITGGSGFVGSAIIPELVSAGHTVLGLARSDAAASALTAAGVTPHRGDVEDHASLASGAKAADGVIHCGFIHDFARFKEVCEIDRHAIAALADALVGTTKPLLVTSGTAILTQGTLSTEAMIPEESATGIPRVATETAITAAAAKGVRAAAIRLSPTVHGDGDAHGFISLFIKTAREKGVSAYIGEGTNRWNAVNRLDAAAVYRLALDKATPGARYHAVGEEGVTFRSVAEAIGKRLNVPVASKPASEAADHFGFMAMFALLDAPASSAQTQAQLGWKPTHPTLLDDLERGSYYFRA